MTASTVLVILIVYTVMYVDKYINESLLQETGLNQIF